MLELSGAEVSLPARLSQGGTRVQAQVLRETLRELTSWTGNVLVDVVPVAVGVEHSLPSEGTQEDGQREFVEIPHCLPGLVSVGGLLVWVVRGQARGGEPFDVGLRLTHGAREGSNQQILLQLDQLVSQLHRVAQRIQPDEGKVGGGSCHSFESHHVFHREAVQHIYKEVKPRVSVPSIELVILETVSNEDVVRVKIVKLGVEDPHGGHQSLSELLLILRGELTARPSVFSTGFDAAVSQMKLVSSIHEDSISLTMSSGQDRAGH